MVPLDERAEVQKGVVHVTLALVEASIVGIVAPGLSLRLYILITRLVSVRGVVIVAPPTSTAPHRAVTRPVTRIIVTSVLVASPHSTAATDSDDHHAPDLPSEVLANLFGLLALPLCGAMRSAQTFQLGLIGGTCSVESRNIELIVLHKPFLP